MQLTGIFGLLMQCSVMQKQQSRTDCILNGVHTYFDMWDWANLIFEIWEMVKIIFEIWDCDNYWDLRLTHFYFWDPRKDKFRFWDLRKPLFYFEMLFWFIYDMNFEISHWFPEIRGKVFFRFEIEIRYIPLSILILPTQW